MAGFISQATLEQIRAASDIVEVIGSYFPLKRAGANFVALCPFHREKTPSFSVSPQRQIFHCFGCHKGGDVFRFVQEQENISFVEAVERLAKRAGIAVEFERDPAAQQSRRLKDTLLEIHEQLTQRWQNALRAAGGGAAREYLARRRVSAEAVNLFRLGYAPNAWDDTVNWARGKGYELALVEQAGLIIAKEGEAHYYDRFRDRLMFPICDQQGRVIGFSGRVLSGDEKTAKYVNSPETPLFTKAKVIYGLDKAKKAMLETGTAVICEGQLDLIACHEAGVQHVVAPQGTALTSDHCRILKRHVDEVVLCFDSDQAGHEAALRALDDLLASGLAVRVAVVPAPHDPDSFIRERGGEAFRRIVEEAKGFFEYYLDRLCALNDLRTDRGRNAVVHAMAEAAHKTGDSMLIDRCARETAARLGVSAASGVEQFKKFRSQPRRPTTQTEPAQAPAESSGSRPSPQESWLVKLLLLDDKLVAWAAAHLEPAWVQHPLVRRVVERRLALQAQEAWQNVAAFLSEFQDASTQQLITEAVSEKREIRNRAQQLTDVVKHLRDQHLERQITELTRQIAEPALPEAQRLVLVQRQDTLLRAQREPLAPLSS